MKRTKFHNEQKITRMICKPRYCFFINIHPHKNLLLRHKSQKRSCLVNNDAKTQWIILSLHRISMFRQRELWLGDCFILSVTKLHHIASTDVIWIRLSGILTPMMNCLMKTGITHVSIRDHRCGAILFLVFNQGTQYRNNAWIKSKVLTVGK